MHWSFLTLSLFACGQSTNIDSSRWPEPILPADHPPTVPAATNPHLHIEVAAITYGTPIAGVVRGARGGEFIFVYRGKPASSAEDRHCQGNLCLDITDVELIWSDMYDGALEFTLSPDNDGATYVLQAAVWYPWHDEPYVSPVIHAEWHAHNPAPKLASLIVTPPHSRAYSGVAERSPIIPAMYWIPDTAPPKPVPSY